MGGFFEQMRADSTLGPLVRANGIQITFVFSDPDLTVTIDGVNPPQQGGDFNLLLRAAAARSAAQAHAVGRQAHRFWQGKLNAMLALAQKQIGIEGSAGRLLALLPVMQPSFARYRAYLQEIGRPDLLV